MGRITAPDRLRRVLAIVPWIVAHPGEKVADVAERFGLSEKALLDDLAVVFMVGLPPYSPDSLVDVLIDEDGCVTIDLADYFSRPLRLTPGQGLALLAASEALLSVPGTEEDGPLARALMKLGRSLGVRYGDSGANLEVKLGDVEADVLSAVRSATKGGHDIEITYYSFGRDTVSIRVISPWRVFSDSGSWYVHGWCTQAQGERIFRLDRITEIRPTDTVSAHMPNDDGGSIGVFHPRADDPTVTLRLNPAVSWVADAYPCEVVERNENGLVITLVVTAQAWFYRLLLRLGPDCGIVESSGMDDPAKGLSETASKILVRYRN